LVAEHKSASIYFVFVESREAWRCERRLLTAHNSARVSITFLISTIRAISLYDRQEFHLMTDKFHFMTDKFHFMTEPTNTRGVDSQG